METINWADLLAQATKAGTPPVAGVPHVSRVESAKWKRSSTQKDGINLRWKIIQGPDENKTFFDTLWISTDNPTAMMMTFNKMRAIGVDPAQLASVPQAQQPDVFVGKMSSVVVKTDREWNGAPQVDVESYGPVTGAGVTPPPPVAAPAPPAAVAPPVVAPPAAPAPVAAPAPAPAPVAAPPAVPPPAPPAPPIAPAVVDAVLASPVAEVVAPPVEAPVAPPAPPTAPPAPPAAPVVEAPPAETAPAVAAPPAPPAKPF